MADRVGLIREGRLDLVDSVENLRARAFTHVEATFAERSPPDAFAWCRACSEMTSDGSVVRFALEGEIDALLKALARFHVKALDGREADLEDVFLARYRARSRMLRSIALKSLRDIAASFLWWSLGVIGFVALIVSVYPTVRSNPSLNKLSKDYPQALQWFLAFGGAVDYSSAAGYLGIELFSLMVPLLLLVAAIGTGAGRSQARRSAAPSSCCSPTRSRGRRSCSRRRSRSSPRSRASASCSGSRSGSARS